MLSFDSFRKSQPARIGVMIGFALLLMVAAVIKEPRRSQAASRLRQSLTVEDRVAAQRAIEEVYQRHRIWPKDNPQPKPALAALMPESALRAKVDDYLRLSNALEHYWRRPISGEQLQAEIERMQSRTKRPEALRELWAALGDDPLVIAECLARPALAERLSREWYASDERFHGALKQQAGLVLGQLRTGGQPRHTSGEYREVEWRADESELARLGHGLEINGVLRLDAAHWQEQVHRLSETFGSAGTTMDLPVGRWSGLQEDDEKFYAAAVLEKSARRLKVAEVVWQKTPFDQWWNEAQHELSLDVQPTAFVFRLPQSAAVPGQCAGEAWTATSTSGAPATRNGHAAVWTGSEMIVWGGLDGVSAFNTGGKYNPATETWTAMSTSGAPSPRSPATGVWTGTEMVIWGGSSGGFVSTGGRYNPSTNSWTPITNSNPPEARGFHTALWSGTEMIIWGGSSGTGANVLFGLNTGGRYNPASDTWMPVSTLSAPGTRLFHTAVWSGSEMLVWGGFSLNAPSPLTWDTGGRYNPSTNTWSATTTSGAPSARASHSAIWTGSEMIIWGGGGPDLDSGGKYNPVNNSWTATSTTNAPAPRRSHTAVWTGSEMIVWGGLTDSSSTSTEFNSGGRYNPITNTWTATSTANAPGARYSQTAVWAGNQMIVWGGLVGSGANLTRLNTGGRYILAGALTISPASQSFTAGGGNGNVSVSAAGSCSWTAASNAPWITITSGGSGSGNGMVGFSVAANTGISPRTGTITITGQTFTVNQAGNDCHTVAGINPTNGIVGSSLTITGTNFTGVTVLRFANNVSAQFTVNSATSITATVPADAVSGPITLGKPNCPDAQTGVFTVRPPNKPSQVTSVMPNPVIAGGQSFTLTVNGSDFVSGSTLRWDGNDRATTFVSATRLTAAIPATDIAMAREVKITVFTPDGGGVSNQVVLTIANAVTSVPAGSFTGTTIAPDSIVAAFGTKLATAVKIATTTPLPTELEGTTVKVTDSMGAERLARLFFVAPMQINYLMPAETAAGAATITVKSGDGAISVGTVMISLATPSLFTANANGQGVAAGVALRVKADNVQVYEPIARFDSTQNRFVPEPIDLSNANEQVYLVLYGSGIRYRSSLSAVTVTVGGLNHPVLFAGAVEGLAGLDQVNVGPLSRSLQGRGEVDVVLIVDGKPANLARASFK